MLTGETWKHAIAFCFCAVTGPARRHALVRDAARKQSASRCNSRRLAFVRLRNRRLRREVLGKLVNLIVGQAPTDAPHVLEAGRIASALLSKTLELSDQIHLLLSGKVRRIRRDARPRDAMAVRTNLLGQHLSMDVRIGEITRTRQIGAGGHSRETNDDSDSMLAFHETSSVRRTDETYAADRALRFSTRPTDRRTRNCCRLRYVPRRHSCGTRRCTFHIRCTGRRCEGIESASRKFRRSSRARPDLQRYCRTPASDRRARNRCCLSG